MPTIGPANLNERRAAGALIYAGYDLLEALVALRGLPDSVTAIIGNYRGGNSPTRETEDTSTALLRYPAGGSAIIRVTWDLPPTSARLVHFSATHRVELTADEVILADVAGNTQDRQPLGGDYLAGELSRFVELVRNRARDRALLPLERHLAVSALLETIYLAARTGHPESPAKLYEAQRWPGPRS